MTEVSTISNKVELATQMTVAWLSNANTNASASDAASFLIRMKEEIARFEGGDSVEPSPPAEVVPVEGAVTARKSLASPNHIISMIDGKPYKTLRRHLSTHGMTPEQYRERFGLKSDYPMVAPSYSEQRRAMAKRIGLGTNTKRRKPGRPAKA